ncbi:MAG TPA: nucleoside recognition domain-containing protein [Candidatus Polarisedimenticolaceae bacterium]
MLNAFFVGAVLLSILIAAFTGAMPAVSQACVESAGKAVTLALGLVGVMAFFLGLMRVASDGGLLKLVARAVAPVMRRLFPTVPEDHPAMSAMVLNIASNMLGLANAATPFGIRAMQELDRLNARKGTATDAMALFLAINTSGLALLPTGVIALRASLGSGDPAGIFFATWFASACATVVGVSAAILLSRLPRYRGSAPGAVAEAGTQAAVEAADEPPAEPLTPPRFATAWVLAWTALFLLGLVVSVGREWGTRPGGEIARAIASYWVLPALVAGLVLFGWARGVKVYASLVEGAKEGFQVALRIIPYLVAILVAVAMFRASGGLEMLVGAIGPWTAKLGLPAEALPMAILRPLSGSGAYGVMAEAMTAHGPDSLIGYMVSVMQGSTETTFYVLAVYFGAVSVRRTRHTVPACLLADLAGLSAAVWISNRLFG